ncbi:MAG: hydantoinase B/oxoprolinase family protein, partial [Rhodospirillales bacterium]|nr:hydantoinase B/oxoprolinase family protein [Rhodospirillales bacterium]
VPPASGAASALGFLAAPLSFEQVRSHPVKLSAPDAAAVIDGALTALEQDARAQLRAAGVADADIVTERSADMRLEGQMHEINVRLPDGAITAAELEMIRGRFAEAYAARYTSVYGGVGIQAISFRVRCRGPLPRLSLTETGGTAATAALKGTRRAFFADGWVEAPVYDRYALAQGMTVAGPAIIEEREATTIVPAGDEVTVDAAGSLRIRIGVAAAPAARITADTPLDQAVALIDGDPVSLEIMWSRLVSVTEEMWHTVCRTAFSLIVSEAQDFACDILDAQGDSLAHSPRAMPVFNLTLPRAAKALLAKFPAETLRPGDVLITNDPWLCAGHLFDVAVVTPAFRDGRLVALIGTVGHVGDIGGTKDSLRAREIYEEGIQIPPMMLYRAGVPNEDLLTLMAENVRKHEEVLGDIHAFVAANAIGAERLAAFMADYGMHDLRALAQVVQTRAEQAMR